jgi:hypothetical protein
MLKRSWFRPDGPWWGPYLGVLACAAVAGLLVLLFVVINAPEVIRVLRAGGA